MPLDAAKPGQIDARRTPEAILSEISDLRASDVIARRPTAFTPGIGGNAVKKIGKTISTALRELLEAGAADKIAKEAIRLALSAKSESVRIAAASWISDRVEGRPMQAMEVRQVVDESTLRTLNALYTAAFPQALETIDAEPVAELTGESG